MRKWKIEITPDCIESLKKKIQLGDNEDCGLLFGSQISDDSIRVNSISDSSSIKTLTRRCSCRLDVEKANQLIQEEYKISNHTRFYIGEWHTHPEDNPMPSTRDISSLKKSYQKNEIAIPNLILMAIIGRKSICWKMYDGNNILDVIVKS